MTYQEAKPIAEKGFGIVMVILDKNYRFHDFTYRKENFPDMTFCEFCQHFWDKYGDEKAVANFYYA